MKFAICHELFTDWDWKRQCQFISETGYTGIEVAPFTLGDHPKDVTQDRRQEMKETASSYGLEIIALHWLLAKTKDIHLTSNDKATRQRTADYLGDLADLCADLGGNLMVLGSPQQRNLAEGMTSEQGTANAIDVFQTVLPRLESRGVDLLLEPLTTKETNFMNTCGEAADIIAAVDNPRLALHQDVKAMTGEGTPIPELIRQYSKLTRHFHANDANLLGPGMGDIDFVPIFEALKETGYNGWVSVEVFDYSPGAEKIAQDSLRYMKEVCAKVGC